MISEEDKRDINAMRRFKFFHFRGYSLGMIWRGPLHLLARLQDGKDHAYGITAGRYMIGVTRHTAAGEDEC